MWRGDGVERADVGLVRVNRMGFTWRGCVQGVEIGWLVGWLVG